jgi:hypothetical protein
MKIENVSKQLFLRVQMADGKAVIGDKEINFGVHMLANGGGIIVDFNDGTSYLLSTSEVVKEIIDAKRNEKDCSGNIS